MTTTTWPPTTGVVLFQRWFTSPTQGQMVTVAQLRTRNRDLLLRYQQVLHRREHASHARRVTVMPRPRTTPD